MSEAPQSYLDGRVVVYAGDCMERLKELPDASVDSVVTDAPYHLQSINKRFAAKGRDETSERYAAGPYGRHAAGFMGQKWDGGDLAFRPELWRQVFRMLRPGGHLVAFSGTRTYHRMATAIDEAGFEIRDQVMFAHEADAERWAFWESLTDEQRAQFAKLFLESDELGQLAWCFGSGFPKSHDVGKAIDKAARGVPHGGADPTSPNHGKFKGGCSADNERGQGFGAGPGQFMAVKGVRANRDLVEQAQAWSGWGTALKPAWEPICIARKPLAGTVAETVQEYGTGALNIDGCRIHADDAQGGEYTVTRRKPGATQNKTGGNYRPEEGGVPYHGEMKPGRWPANICHNGSDEVLAAFPDAGGGDNRTGGGGTRPGGFGNVGHDKGSNEPNAWVYSDGGSAARFFYTAKADQSDRLSSTHPTIKPLDLMQWLVRLVTPKRVLSCPRCDIIGHAQNRTETACSDTPMCVVSDGLQTEGQSAHGKVLQPAMCGCGQGSEAEAMRLVRDDVPAKEGRGAAVLQPVLRGEVDRQEQEDQQGLRNQQGGLQAAVDARSPAVACAEGLHLRASMGDAANDRSPANKKRSRASQKRNQVRQSPGELGTDAEGRSRQAEPSSPEHTALPSLSGEDRHEPTCAHCGHRLEWRPGICLDPFAGTGTTGEAAWREGMSAILIESHPDYLKDIARRMELADKPGKRSAVVAAAKKKTEFGKTDDLPLFAE